MVKLLRVYCTGWGERWLLGTLAANGNELLFEYAAEALRQGLELSPLRLPLRTEAFGGFPAHQFHLPGLIADALPDGWGLLLMDRLFRRQGLPVSAISPLDRLAFVGERAMGALVFEPADDVPSEAAELSLRQAALDAAALMQGQGSKVLQQMALIGGSPQGARPKVLVYIDPRSDTVSSQAQPGFEPWLVKFQAQGEHKEVCAVEAWYAELARQCGVDVPQTRHFDLGRNLAAFGSARFDREGGLRVPVHTVAGALNADFRRPGSVDYGNFLRLTRLFTRDEREVRKAFERAAFNVLFNNRDDHPKNLSFRMDRDRRWRLAPAYDLTFAEGMGGEHAMDVAGHGKDITRQQMLQLATQGGLQARWAAEVLERMAAVASRIDASAAEWPIRVATRRRIAVKVAAQVAGNFAGMA